MGIIIKKDNVIQKDNKSLSKKITTKEIKEKRNNNKSDFNLVIQDTEFISQLKEIYPSVDIRAAIADMRAWLLINPPKKDYYRFMTNWVRNSNSKYTAKEVNGDPIDRLSKEMGLQT